MLTNNCLRPASVSDLLYFQPFERYRKDYPPDIKKGDLQYGHLIFDRDAMQKLYDAEWKLRGYEAGSPGRGD